MKRIVALIVGIKIGLLGISLAIEKPVEVVEAYEDPRPVVELMTTSEYEDYVEERDSEPILIEVEIEWTQERIIELVYEKAEKYNTFPEKMWGTIKCENPELDPELQSYVVKNGIREDSWGLAQFYLPAKNKTASGEVITKDMAQDPEIALDAMAYHFSIGNAHLWSCYKIVYGLQ